MVPLFFPLISLVSYQFVQIRQIVPLLVSDCGVKEIAVFTTASETFSRKNTNCDVQTSLTRCEDVIKLAQKDGVKVRGYVSCIVGCPYEGFVPPESTAKVRYRKGLNIQSILFRCGVLCSDLSVHWLRLPRSMGRTVWGKEC